MAPSHETCHLESWATCRVAISQRSATSTTGAQGGERHSCLVCSSLLGSHSAETCHICNHGEVKVYQAPPPPPTHLCPQLNGSVSSTVDKEDYGLEALGPFRRLGAVHPLLIWLSAGPGQSALNGVCLACDQRSVR